MKLDLNKKKVTIIGLGRSGLSAAFLLQYLGSDVWVSDSKNTDELKKRAGLLKDRAINVELGKHSKDFIRGSELVVLSPGVANNSKIVAWIEKIKIPIISEIELAYRVCPAKIIAVTGTNGKTTVATLIGKMLNHVKKKAIVCGNIGNPFSGEVLSINPQDIVVLEASSFQLEKIVYFRPYIAVFLNITEDHLDRYNDFDTYLKTKTAIFSNQTEKDWALLNKDDPILNKLNSFTKAHVRLFHAAGINPNYSAVLEIGSILGIDKASIFEVFHNFNGVEHRLEYVEMINGVRFINDSKATNVSSTIWALKQSKQPVILIAGGRDKGSNFKSVVPLIKEKVKAVILFGEAREVIKKALGNNVLIKDARSLDKAVELSKQIAERDDTVLFSPMCASFDMFNNFEERGRIFKETVRIYAKD